MGTVLITLGLLAWFLVSMIAYVFLTIPSDSFQKRLIDSINIRFIKRTGPEFGISLMQVTGVFWVIAGLIINLIGESFLQGIVGDIILGIIFLGPVWIGAIIAERRKKGL